ncbi:glycosyltransferase [Rhodoplanes roseus]|uniref:Glycosyltransferase subfamily 4-like N-terminal domain-containing protein n=1 Tax=Rhodoplanes roseus TaxID=29409 RepID=A0A327L3U3_9BRAD|nr:glycosyltransferase [Rhodoplanes roseus]RAI45740.1 hypothetical protein CH341_02215 [Rhodoplanes roseus]
MVASALVVASPWPRSGSANIFSAQARYFASRGYKTAMLLSPHLAVQRSKYTHVWEHARATMASGDLDLMCCATATGRMKPWRSRSFFEWLANGRDSQLAVMARYSAANALPPELDAFLDAHPPRVLLVNHCFQMGMAATVLRRLAARGLPRPRLVLETHDVQADLYARGRVENVFRRQPDEWATLARDELRVATPADMFTHVSERDLAYFSARLPGRHNLVLGTLAPAAERELLAIGDPGPEAYDFVYVGNNNPGNEVSLIWFLNEVAPRLDPSVRVAVVGRIGQHLSAMQPALFARWAHWFVGEVETVTAIYERAGVVILPTKFGTGISIKAIEALATGRPVVATSDALRALPAGLHCDAIARADEAADFAAAMADVHARRATLRGLTRDIYMQRFSNGAFFARWDAVLADVPTGIAAAPQAERPGDTSPPASTRRCALA